MPAFLRDLVARGLSGVEAVGATVPGAAWHRCRTHYAANSMAVCPTSSWP
ncbi:Transposase, Mutator family [Geodermatophilus amargosae]|uniref:Transposase, Mutator family n=1 Tax=Geodermatophilus amargosae TaxID=1296565 RepID=A0A1I7AVX6_9ACTN|nr:Transposase, Mutator family [Geodermatophilus amargosae]